MIELDNSIGDFLSVSSYTFTNYRSSRYANVRVLGSVGPNCALLWMQNTNYNWLNVYQNNPIPAIVGAATVMHGLAPGKYDVSYVDPSSGNVVRVDHERSTSSAGLPLNLPKVDTDFALIVSPARSN